MAPRAGKREREEPEADGDEDHQARQGPVRDLRGGEDVPDQQQHREEVEDAMGEDRADERRPRVGAAPLLLVAGEDRDPRELADAAREHRVCEEADAEGGEDLRGSAASAAASPAR